MYYLRPPPPGVTLFHFHSYQLRWFPYMVPIPVTLFNAWFCCLLHILFSVLSSCPFQFHSYILLSQAPVWWFIVLTILGLRRSRLHLCFLHRLSSQAMQELAAPAGFIQGSCRYFIYLQPDDQQLEIQLSAYSVFWFCIVPLCSFAVYFIFWHDCGPLHSYWDP